MIVKTMKTLISLQSHQRDGGNARPTTCCPAHWMLHLIPTGLLVRLMDMTFMIRKSSWAEMDGGLEGVLQPLFLMATTLRLSPPSMSKLKSERMHFYPSLLNRDIRELTYFSLSL